MATHKQSRLNKMFQAALEMRMMTNDPEQLKSIEDEIKQIQKERDAEYRDKAHKSNQIKAR